MMRHVNELYLGWYGDNLRSWYPVGRFSIVGDEYVFQYLHGASVAKREAGFRGVFQFPDFERTYRSTELFAFVANRVMSSRRPDYADFTRLLGLDPDGLRPFDMLSRSNGRRMTDTFELYAAPIREDDTVLLDFFARGVRNLDEHVRRCWTESRPAGPLRLEREADNEHDPFAIKITDAEDRSLGYVPRYYTESLSKVVESGCSYELSLEQHNREPGFVRERFLLCLRTKVPAGWHFPQSAMYDPVEAHENDSEVA